MINGLMIKQKMPMIFLNNPNKYIPWFLVSILWSIYLYIMIKYSYLIYQYGYKYWKEIEKNEKTKNK